MTSLPELDDQRIDEIENALFARIAQDREEREERRRRNAAAARDARRRRTTWLTVGGAAAALIVAVAVIAPNAARLTGSAGGANDSAASGAWTTAEGGTSSGSELSPQWVDGADAPAAPEAGVARDGSGTLGGTDAEAAGRDIVATASATLVVDDPALAADDISARVRAADGYVESLRLNGAAGTGDAAAPDSTVPDSSADSDIAIWPPTSPTGSGITVRVPAGALEGVIAQLGDIGEVTASQITRDDVTTQTVDLRARVSAAQTSVQRLTDLLAQSGSLSDLIAAESALAERQAELESLQQQLTSLESQVDMSSLTVDLQPRPATVDADPAGFGDGVSAGWNGLVVSMNAIIIALGFLLPWLGVAAIALVVVWLVRRTVRRRRGGGEAAE